MGPLARTRVRMTNYGVISSCEDDAPPLPSPLHHPQPRRHNQAAMQQARSDADAGRGPPDQSRAKHDPVLLAETGALHVEQLRPPDRHEHPGRKLRPYLTDQASLQPQAGDQGVTRCVLLCC